jgi:uncharacterized protein (TIGR03437 family)
MDAAQLFKRSVFFVAAGMLAATASQAADLTVDNSNVVITGRVQSATVLVQSATATPFTIRTTYSGAAVPAWLSVGADNGNATPSHLTVALSNDLASYGAGPFNATVILTPTPGGAAATINVQYQPGGGAPPANLTVTPAPTNPNYSLTLAYTTNGVLPQQSVNVSGVTSYSASVTYDTSGSLQLSAAGVGSGTALSGVPGSQPLTVQLTQAAVALVTGTYYGTVVINVPTIGQAIINVTITVNGGSGTLVVNPGSLVFAYQNAGQISSIPTQTLVTTAPAGSTFMATATSDKGWLFLDAPSQGPIPGNLQVYAVIPQGGLTAATYSGSVTITSGGFSQKVQAQLLVSDSAVLVPSVTAPGGTTVGTVVFNLQNGVVTPSSQTVSLTASDRSALTGLALVSVPSFASVNLTGTTLTVTPSSGLTGAVYAGTVVVSTNLANGQVPIPVIVVGNAAGTAGPLTLSQSSFVFQALVNGTAPVSQTLNVSAPAQTTFTANSSSNAPWLSISPSGSLLTNQAITISVNPAAAGATAGTLTGYIFLTANGGAPQPVTVTLQLSGNTGGGNVTTDQSSLNFSAQAGGATPGAKYLVVSNALSGTAGILYTVSTSTSWLNATPSQSTTQSSITVTVNPTGLSPGTYQGTITITPSGGNALSIPVTLTVQPVATISTSTTSLTFAYRAGGDVPAAQSVQTSGAAFTAQASSDGNWLSVSPATGTSGGSISASVSNLVGLSIGVHSGTITVTGTNGASGVVVINVTLNVSAPLPTITAVVNAASYASGSISPGEVITLGGTDLGPASEVTAQLDSTGKVATQLGGVSVLVNGFPAPLIYVAGTQVSAVVPYEVARFQTVSAQVRYLGQTSNAASLAVSPTAPGIFTLNSSGSGPGAFNADFSLNGPNNPVSRGGIVTFFLTGEGQTNPLGVTGTINPASAPAPVANIAIAIDGQPATYTYAGGVTGAVEGLMQLNVRIPATARSGDLGVVVSIGGVPSQSGVTVSVQ